jgi:hypothetical protein
LYPTVTVQSDVVGHEILLNPFSNFGVSCLVHVSPESAVAYIYPAVELPLTAKQVVTVGHDTDESEPWAAGDVSDSQALPPSPDLSATGGDVEPSPTA